MYILAKVADNVDRYFCGLVTFLSVLSTIKRGLLGSLNKIVDYFSIYCFRFIKFYFINFETMLLYEQLLFKDVFQCIDLLYSFCQKYILSATLIDILILPWIQVYMLSLFLTPVFSPLWGALLFIMDFV